MNDPQILHGDCLDLLPTLPDCSVDAIVTDPPAGIGFMGKAWDHDKGGRRQWVEWMTAVMTECHRVLKPGGHAIVWALPRTSHWTAWAIEDGGLEIRDCLTHIFGSGFPKSLAVDKAIDKAAGAEREVVGTKLGLPGYSLAPSNMDHRTYSRGLGNTSDPMLESQITAPATDAAKQWQGWGTALKPAAEHWWLARRPLSGTVAATVLAHGTGALNIDACRVGTSDNLNGGGYSATPTTGSFLLGGCQSLAELVGLADQDAKTPNGETARAVLARATRPLKDGPGEYVQPAGRWPANVVLSHAPTCDTGCAPGCPVAELDAQSGELAGSGSPTVTARPRLDNWRITEGRSDRLGQVDAVDNYGDSGGASRFFATFRYEAKAPTVERPRVGGIAHPTTKPLDLMRWLVRLVTPPGGTVLDPFAGSGTTVEACIAEGFHCIAIEREADYLPLIRARITRRLDPVAYHRETRADDAELSLFDLEEDAS